MSNVFQQMRIRRREKKKALQKRIKAHQGVFNLMLARRSQSKIDKDQKELAEKEKKKKRSKEEEKRMDKKETWSVQVSSIRNLLNNKRRTSDDRWNRFAGTEDGGGRGR
jgi:Zn-dependent peptidase ImmA (M78 family)